MRGRSLVRPNVDLQEDDRKRWLSNALSVARVFSDTKNGSNRNVRFAAQKYVSKNMHLRIIEERKHGARSRVGNPHESGGIIKNQNDEGVITNGFRCAAKRLHVY